MKKIICVLLTLFALLCTTACSEPITDAKTYTFRSGSVSVAIDSEAAGILAALGEWNNYSESPSCAFNGLDKIYAYAGFRIQTYPLNGKDYIYSVELTDDSVTTSEGIAVGSTVEQVKTAYGTPTDETATLLLYKGEGVNLQFILRDGKVTNIQYLRVE